jgi:hypothetical protein
MDETMRAVRMRIGLAVATVALLAAGCGGDDEEAEPLTTEEFITQADEICATSTDEFDAALEELGAGGQPSDEEAATFISETLVPNAKDQAAQIDALAAPEGDEEEVDAIVTALNDAVAEGESDPEAVIASEDDPFDEFETLAEDYGLTECR